MRVRAWVRIYCWRKSENNSWVCSCSTWNTWIFFLMISVKAELDPPSGKYANKGERMSFRSWPIGYDKLATPITLRTSELSKWWDHISVRCLYTQSVLRCCLSISLPICVSPYLLHLTVSHKRERRERWGSVMFPRSRLIHLGLLALRYQGDWHLANASRRWRDR